MKNNLIVVMLLTGVFIIFSCKKEIIREPQAYEDIEMSFSLSDLGESYEFEYLLCDEANRVASWMQHTATTNYYYYTRYQYSFFHPRKVIGEVFLWVNAVGVERLTSSSDLKLEDILELYENNPEHVFVSFSIEHNGEKYRNKWNTVYPFEIQTEDPNATSSFRFILDTPQQMECLYDSYFIPVEFEYNGFIYTEEREDSLKISDFKSSFLLLKSF